MITRYTFLRTSIAAATVALAVAGCGQMRPSQKMDIYEATLSSAQEVPPNSSPARGMAELQMNTNTNVLHYKVTYSGLSGPATGGHIHGPAAAGANAGVVVPFTGNLNAQPVEGQVTITPTQYGDLAAGLWYVNIHSAQFPGGEIRGQLRKRQ
ncbi:MAG: CHRD domain-containing protein [Ramlibacter sp.]|nr:CHRD domain-containing protein [Ramlibacter sp.]